MITDGVGLPPSRLPVMPFRPALLLLLLLLLLPPLLKRDADPPLNEVDMPVCKRDETAAGPLIEDRKELSISSTVRFAFN